MVRAVLYRVLANGGEEREVLGTFACRASMARGIAHDYWRVSEELNRALSGVGPLTLVGFRIEAEEVAEPEKG
jgi:hypothetical protein